MDASTLDIAISLWLVPSLCLTCWLMYRAGYERGKCDAWAERHDALPLREDDKLTYRS